MTSTHVHSLYRQNSPLCRLDFFLRNINAEKPKFYFSHSSIFYTGGLFRNQKSPSSLVHFDLFCLCLFWWKISGYFKALVCFWHSKNAISLLFTIPNCTEAQQYIILLWSTILGNCSLHGRLSILVGKIPLLWQNLIQIWKFLGWLEPLPRLPLLRAWRLSWIESTIYVSNRLRWCL